VPLADDTSFLDVVWWMVIFFAFVIWVWLAITVFMDIFRRHDISGWVKAIWVIFIIVLPYLGVLVYLIAEHKGMAERNAEQISQAQQAFDQEVKRATGTDAAGQIEKAHGLLEKGAISQQEFDRLKTKALS
jgi:uncharacterized membrane protein YcjF (UPF0283 family)